MISDDTELSNSKFAVYPNPNNGLLQVDILTTTMEGQTISVFDITGRVLKSFTIPADSPIDHIQVDLTGVATGIYFFEWKTNTQNVTERIIIE